MDLGGVNASISLLQLLLRSNSPKNTVSVLHVQAGLDKGKHRAVSTRRADLLTSRCPRALTILVSGEQLCLSWAVLETESGSRARPTAHGQCARRPTCVADVWPQLSPPHGSWRCFLDTCCRWMGLFLVWTTDSKALALAAPLGCAVGAAPHLTWRAEELSMALRPRWTVATGLLPDTLVGAQGHPPVA